MEQITGNKTAEKNKVSASIIFDQSIELNGINKIIESSKDTIILESSQKHTIVIKGSNLEFNNLSLEDSYIFIKGVIDSISRQHSKDRTPLIKRLFK